MNLGTLIECPTCQENGKRNVLGRMVSGGKVEIQRFHRVDGVTTIYAGTIAIACSCGFQGTITKGTFLHEFL